MYAIYTNKYKIKCLLTWYGWWRTLNKTMQKNATETKITMHPVCPIFIVSVLAILSYLYTFGNLTFCLRCVLIAKCNSEVGWINNFDSLRELGGRDYFFNIIYFPIKGSSKLIYMLGKYLKLLYIYFFPLVNDSL